MKPANEGKGQVGPKHKNFSYNTNQQSEESEMSACLADTTKASKVGLTVNNQATSWPLYNQPMAGINCSTAAGSCGVKVDTSRLACCCCWCSNGARIELARLILAPDSRHWWAWRLLALIACLALVLLVPFKRPIVIQWAMNDNKRTNPNNVLSLYLSERAKTVFSLSLSSSLANKTASSRSTSQTTSASIKLLDRRQLVPIRKPLRFSFI